MSEDSLLNESQRVKNIREDLDKWLTVEKWESEELRNWIKGYEFFTYGEEPYLWLLRCLPKSSKYSSIMAERIAAFLETEDPYKKNKATKEDDARFFYNLFNLSAFLNYRGKLGKQLAKIFDYFKENEEERKSFFAEEEWYNLNNAFREALINNQVNNNFRDIWQDGLAGKQSSFLITDIYSSFRGILYLPDAKNPDKPDVEKIGWALKKMADYLEPEKKRHEKFCRLLERIKEVWADYPNWDEVLFRQAVKHEWQNWATVRLDNIVMPVNGNGNGTKRYFIWEIYMPFLEELKVGFTVVERKNILIEIDLSREAALFIEKTSMAVESNRKNSSNRSYQGVKLASNEAFKEFVDEFKSVGKIEAAEATQIARFKVLTSRLPQSQQQTATENLAVAAAS
jgi:hypothetical protein